MSGAVSISVDQLREVASQCRRNAPMLVDSQKTNVEAEMKKGFEATNQAGFDQLHQAAIKNSRDVYEPIAEALSTVAKVLEEMADRTEEVNKSSVSI